MHDMQQLWLAWGRGEIDDAANRKTQDSRRGEGATSDSSIAQPHSAAFSESRRGVSRPKVRATAREAEWRQQIHRAFVYATGQAPEAAEALLAEFESRERKGPDFLRIRPRSVFAEAPVINLDRNERIRLITKFRSLARRSWQTKDKGKHRGIVTRTANDVFLALMYLAEKYHRVFPSIEGLMHLAMCCKQSVVTALEALEQLGFVTRIRRIRRIMTPLGFTTRQITNAYDLHEPSSGLGLLAITLFATESNCWTPSGPDFNPKKESGDQKSLSATPVNGLSAERGL